MDDDEDDGLCAWLYVAYGQCGRDKGEGLLGEEAMLEPVFRGEPCLGISVMTRSQYKIASLHDDDDDTRRSQSRSTQGRKPRRLRIWV